MKTTELTKQFNKLNASTQSAIQPENSSLVELYSSIGSMRDWKSTESYKLFDKAVAEDCHLATKVLFYGRDIKEGLGERNTFRLLLQYAAKKYPSLIKPNIPLIGYYGRFDDLYLLMDTPLEQDMWNYMKEQFKKDLKDSKANKPISLLAKWIKTPNASSITTRTLGVLTSLNLGYPNVKEFKKDLKFLRKYLNITERNVCNNDFSSIDYDKVSYNAMKKYYKLFDKKDEERFNAYLNSKEDNIIKSSNSPCDIVKNIINDKFDNKDELDKLWNNLPDYYNQLNVLPLIDLSDDMYENYNIPIASAIAMSIYCSKKSSGYFKNKYVILEDILKFKTISNSDSLYNNVTKILTTDAERPYSSIEKLYKCILDYAKKHQVSNEELPKTLLIISNKDIDEIFDDTNNSNLLKDIEELYKSFNYSVPKIVYWIASTKDNSFFIHNNLTNTIIISGYSNNSFNNVINSLSMSQYEAMLYTLNKERYNKIIVN